MNFPPEFLESFQEAYVSTVEAQVAATLALLVGLGVLGVAVSYAGRPLKRRYSSRLTEATQAGVLVVGILVAAAVLTVVWDVPAMFSVAIEAVLISRWDALRGVLSVAVFVVAYLLIRLVNRSIDKLTEDREALTDHQSEVAYHVADVGIFAFASLVVLTLWGTDLGNLFIGAGVLGVVLGLAARTTLGAIMSGFVLLFVRPFRVGDWIEVDDQEGIVSDITIVNTEIRTFDDEHILIPNDVITNNQLVNRTQNDRLRIELDVGVDYETDLEHAREVAVEAVEGVEETLSVPAPKAVHDGFGDSSIGIRLQFWIDKPSARRRWKARTAAVQAVKEAFDREGVSIPYPQRTLGARSEAAARAAAVGARLPDDGDDRRLEASTEDDD